MVIDDIFQRGSAHLEEKPKDHPLGTRYRKVVGSERDVSTLNYTLQYMYESIIMLCLIYHTCDA